MTPEEQKAKELVGKYEKIIVDANADSWGKDAKACALIAVDEIIKSSPSRDTLPDVTSIYYDEVKEAIRYWQSVKQAIQEL